MGAGHRRLTIRGGIAMARAAFSALRASAVTVSVDVASGAARWSTWLGTAVDALETASPPTSRVGLTVAGRFSGTLSGPDQRCRTG